jgi:hypothetical protein
VKKEVQETYSSFKNNKTAGKGKAFLSALLDYFSQVVISFILLVSLLMPVTYLLPSFKAASSTMSATRSELYKIVSSTRIQDYDETQGTLKDISVSAKAYISILAKTSYYISNKQYPAKDSQSGTYVFSSVPLNETFLFKGSKDAEGNYGYPNDSLSYFFLTFKAENASLGSYIYEGKDYAEDKETYLYGKIMQVTSDPCLSYFASEESYAASSYKAELSRFQMLKEETAKNLMNYLVYGDTNSALKETYDNLLVAYERAAQEGVKQVESSYEPYISLNASFLTSYKTVGNLTILAFSLSSLLSVFIVYWLIPGLAKKKQTLGQMGTKTISIRTDETDARTSNRAKKTAMMLLLSYSSCFFSVAFLGEISLLAFDFGGGVTFLSLILFSSGLDLISVAFLLFNKEHQSLSDLVSSEVLKDKEAFDAPPLSDEKLEEKNDGQSGN